MILFLDVGNASHSASLFGRPRPVEKRGQDTKVLTFWNVHDTKKAASSLGDGPKCTEHTRASWIGFNEIGTENGCGDPFTINFALHKHFFGMSSEYEAAGSQGPNPASRSRVQLSNG